MNDSEVSKQVQQMVHFIRQEAEEKANEISVSAEEVRNNLFYNAFPLSAVIRDCFVRAMCVNGCFFLVMSIGDCLDLNPCRESQCSEAQYRVILV